MTDIKAPAMGESIAEATVAKWAVKVGDVVAADQLVAELETDKVNLEVTAPAAGTIASITAPAGSTVKVGQLMATITAGAAAPKPAPAQPASAGGQSPVSSLQSLERSGPAVRKLAADQGTDTSNLQGTGKDGRLTKADILADRTATPAPSPVIATPSSVLAPPSSGPSSPQTASVAETRVPMTRIRKTIATRLKQAQNTAAMLTTYNEVDLTAVNELRSKYKELFEKKHGTKLGYMGFFTRAVTAALADFPALNAEIDGDDIVYKSAVHIGVAVSSEKGLFVPVVKHANTLDVAGIEREIAALGKLARDGGLQPSHLTGATFSITNGGVFGSLMSMPILNYPQVGILGMHAIKDRPIAVNGQVVIRPMMYLALTYDHRIVDGREAVSFLVKVKDALEDPARLMLGV